MTLDLRNFNSRSIDRITQEIKASIVASNKDGIKKDILVENWLKIKFTAALPWPMYEHISAKVLEELDIKLVKELGFSESCADDVFKKHRPSVSVEVFSVREVYLDDKRVDNHCGVVIVNLLDKLDLHPNQNSDVPLILLPRLRFKSLNRFTSNPLPYSYDDISKVFWLLWQALLEIRPVELDKILNGKLHIVSISFCPSSKIGLQSSVLYLHGFTVFYISFAFSLLI